MNDHLPIFCMIDTNRVINGTEKSYIRDLGNFKHDFYCNDLKESLQNFLFYLSHIDNHSNSYDHVFQEFVFTVKSIIDKHAPLKLTTRKQRRLNKKPWITKGLLILTRKKQKFYKIHFLRGSDAEKEIYKRYSNKLHKVKYILKKKILIENLRKINITRVKYGKL